MRAARALTRAVSRDLFLHKMASPVLLIERHAPGVRLSCPKKCEQQDAAKIFNLKYPEHDCLTLFGPAAAERQPSGAPATRSVAGGAAQPRSGCAARAPAKIYKLSKIF